MSIRLAEANRAIQAALAKAVTPMAVSLPSSVWTARLLKLIGHHTEKH